MSEENKLELEELNEKPEEKKEETQKEPESKQEQDVAEDWTKVKGLEKFGSANELGKAYLELQKKMGSNVDLSKLNDDGLIEETKKIYGDLSKQESGLEGSLGVQSLEMSEKLGIPTKFTDMIVGKTATMALTARAAKNIREVSDILSDPIKKQQLITGVKAKGGELQSGFNERLQKGQVTKAEVELLIDSGAPLIDTGSGIEGEHVEGSDPSTALAELADITDNQADIWSNPKHPQYLEVKSRINKLKKISGIA